MWLLASDHQNGDVAGWVAGAAAEPSAVFAGGINPVASDALRWHAVLQELIVDKLMKI